MGDTGPGAESPRERSGSARATHHQGGVTAAHLRALGAPKAGLARPRGAGFPSRGPGHASRRRKLEARVLGDGP